MAFCCLNIFSIAQAHILGQLVSLIDHLARFLLLRRQEYFVLTQVLLKPSCISSSSFNQPFRFSRLFFLACFTRSCHGILGCRQMTMRTACLASSYSSWSLKTDWESPRSYRWRSMPRVLWTSCCPNFVFAVLRMWRIKSNNNDQSNIFFYVLGILQAGYHDGYSDWALCGRI